MPQTLQVGQFTYSGTDGFWALHHFMWDSRFIGQVKEGLKGESIIFEMPQIITPIQSSDTSNACDKRVEVCLDKEKTELKIDHFTSTSHKVDKCDLMKASEISEEINAANYAKEIEFQYAKTEDAEWLADIESKLPLTTLEIGGLSSFGSTITSFNALLIQMISEVSKNVNKEEIAVALSQDAFAEISSLYGSCCYLGSNGPSVKLGANDLGVKSLYVMKEEFRNGVSGATAGGSAVTIGGFTEDTHIMVYPWKAAIKGIACQYVGWDDGAGSEANKAFYNRDADYLVDFKKLRESDVDYTGLKYSTIVTP